MLSFEQSKKIVLIYILAILLGIITGVVGSGFQLAIRMVDELLMRGFQYAQSLGWPVSVISAVTSMLMVFTAWCLVAKLAPEAAGCGVQEIEGALLHTRKVRWKQLLPVKFIGGILAISAKMVQGREGPTIQMGGNLGAMLSSIFHISSKLRDTLIAAGSAAGLAVAFNAPLAGILFVLEEMREQFDFSFINFKTVAIACIMSTIVLRCILGNHPAIDMPTFVTPSLHSLETFLILGIVVGFAGWLFNVALMKSLSWIDTLSMMRRGFYASAVGLLIGYAAYTHPLIVGAGYNIIQHASALSPNVHVLVTLLVIRFFTTILCYNTSIPGGIFAPMLAMGTLLGLAIYSVCSQLGMDISAHKDIYAIAAMGALFAASIRAPLTGIVLVVEMTQNYLLILPLMVACLTATTVVQLSGNLPIYTQLLKRTLRQHLN